MPTNQVENQAILAARELLRRRRARKGLLASILYCSPWYEVGQHHGLIAAALERTDGISTTPSIFNGVHVKLPDTIPRLMIFAPPRHGKSELASIRKPIWSIGNDVLRSYMVIAYGSDLAGTMSKACTGHIQSDPFQRLFPLKIPRKAVERWKVQRPALMDNQRDSMIASGIMSPLTGEGASNVSIDDPLKNRAESYSKTIRDRVEGEYQTSIRTRLQKEASITLTMTRWHQDDLAGRLIKMAQQNKAADQWVVLCLAATNDDGYKSFVWNTATDEKQYLPAYEALWPQKFDRKMLDATRASMSSAFWDAMYMQAPSSATGDVFRAENWNEYDSTQPLQLERAIHVWDTAQEANENADYSAYLCLGIADGRFIVRDAYRGRLAFPDLVGEVYRRWDADVAARVPLERLLIEQKSSGISLLQTIQANNEDPGFRGSRIPVQGMPARESKIVRALSVSGYQAAKLVYLPAPIVEGGMVYAQPWVADFVDELTAFPRGKNDDQVDCMVHALTWYTRPQTTDEDGEVYTTMYDTGGSLIPDLDRIDRGW